MINITKLPMYEEFIEDCKFFYCKNPDVYGPDWSGTENYIIASELPENTMVGKYPEIMQALSPYLYCDAACGEAIAEGMRNNQKFEKRRSNFIHYELDEDFEQKLSSQDDSACANPIEQIELQMMCEKALSFCTEVEKERLVKYFYLEMNLTEIANGKSFQAISYSINEALKKIRKKMTQQP